MEVSIKDNRITQYDVILGIMIVAMIGSHCTTFGGGIIEDNFAWVLFFRSFHCFVTSYFFFKSGMFHKDTRSIKQIVKGGVNRLLIPYISFILVSQCLYIIIYLLRGVNSTDVLFVSPVKSLIANNYTPANLPLWFLLTLFIVRILFALLRRCYLHKGLIILMSFAAAFSLNYISITKPAIIGSSMVGLMFYALGSFMKDYQYKTTVFVTSLALIVAIELFEYSVLVPFNNSLQTGSYVLGAIISLSWIMVINNLFKRMGCKVMTMALCTICLIVWIYVFLQNGLFENSVAKSLCYAITGVTTLFFLLDVIIHEEDNTLFNKVGRESIVFFVCHWPLFYIAHAAYKIIEKEDIWLFYDLRILALWLLLPVMYWVLNRKTLKWMIGKK